MQTNGLGQGLQLVTVHFLILLDKYDLSSTIGWPAPELVDLGLDQQVESSLVVTECKLSFKVFDIFHEINKFIVSTIGSTWDILLRSIDGKYFPVHRSAISLHSNLYTFPFPDRQLQLKQNGFLQLAEESGTIHLLLRYIYPLEYHHHHFIGMTIG